jgi:hypothetical protein
MCVQTWIWQDCFLSRGHMLISGCVGAMVIVFFSFVNILLAYLSATWYFIVVQYIIVHPHHHSLLSFLYLKWLPHVHCCLFMGQYKLSQLYYSYYYLYIHPCLFLVLIPLKTSFTFLFYISTCIFIVKRDISSVNTLYFNDISPSTTIFYPTHPTQPQWVSFKLHKHGCNVFLNIAVIWICNSLMVREFEDCSCVDYSCKCEISI